MQVNKKPERPIGITIIAILEAIGGLYLILGGILLLIIMTLINAMFNPSGSPGGMGSIGGSGIETQPIFTLGFYVALVFIIILAICNFMLAYGFWFGKRWAWKTGMIFPFIGVIGAIIIILTKLDLSQLISVIPSIVFGIIVIIYLFQPNVKTYFGVA